MKLSLKSIAFLVLALCLAAPLAGCGRDDKVAEGETEGIYVDVGDVQYQVQISRQLNPANVEDQSYLEGLPPGTRQPTRAQTWFGVFLRAQNVGDKTVNTASKFEIFDTNNTNFEPIELERSNPFAYFASPLPPDGVLPVDDSPAASGPIQGAMLLFKLPIRSFSLRPLKLRIIQPGVKPAEAEVALDL